MKALEKRKSYRRYCARQLRKGLVPDPSTGNWVTGAGFPESTRHNLAHCAHPGARRSGE